MGSTVRKLSVFSQYAPLLTICRATLANGVFPGPLIQANKVTFYDNIWIGVCNYMPSQHDDFVLRVFNQLTDTSQVVETSIVSVVSEPAHSIFTTFHSIGTGFSSTSPTGPTVLHLSPSAHFFKTKRLRTTLMLGARPERIGTTPIIKHNIAMESVGHWSSMILKTL
jgi:hypothetical protein